MGWFRLLIYWSCKEFGRLIVSWIVSWLRQPVMVLRPDVSISTRRRTHGVTHGCSLPIPVHPPSTMLKLAWIKELVTLKLTNWNGAQEQHKWNELEFWNFRLKLINWGDWMEFNFYYPARLAIQWKIIEVRIWNIEKIGWLCFNWQHNCVISITA